MSASRNTANRADGRWGEGFSHEFLRFTPATSTRPSDHTDLLRWLPLRIYLYRARMITVSRYGLVRNINV
jgi:hypothetical protein